MKKSIIYLGLALVAFVNVAMASNVNYSAPRVTNPLCIAISKGDVEVAKKIIEYGADVNQTEDGKTPLMYAARYNNIEIVKLLIEKGANLKAKDEKGNTALKYAEMSKANEAAEVLKEAMKK